MYSAIKTIGSAVPWNKGKMIGQKPPGIWAIRVRLELARRTRE